jgi:transposase
VGGCRGSASGTRCYGCCGARTWRRCRALGVTAATLSGWRDAFLAAGEASLSSRPAAGEELESERLKARLGEMLLREELLEAKIAALEGGRPLARRRRTP